MPSGSSPLPLVLALAGAPLLPGLVNRVKARMAGRSGPPLLQLYYDLRRLAAKGAVVSRTTTRVFRVAPAVAVAAPVLAAALVPLGAAPSLLSAEGDLLLLVGLLAAARFATVLAALDTGSAFTGMGASREAAIGALAEPGLLLALAALARMSGELSLAGMGAAFAGGRAAGASVPALALAAASLVVLLLAENARIPVDDPNTHLELTMIHEVQLLDHSGPDLALLEYGAAVKFWLFTALAAGAVLPALGLSGAGAPEALAVMGAIVLGVGIVESSMARLRLLRVPTLLTAAAAFGILALIATLRGAA